MSEDEIEAEFIKLLDEEVKKDGNVRPLSPSLMAKIHEIEEMIKQALDHDTQNRLQKSNDLHRSED